MVFQVAGEVLQEKFAQRHGSQFITKGAHTCWRKTGPSRTANLHEFDIGVILSAEQIDVRRRLLLADSPTAPNSGRRDSFYFRFSTFDFRVSF